MNLSSAAVFYYILFCLNNWHRTMPLLADTHTLDCFAFHRKSSFIRFQEFLKARGIFRIGRKC